MARHHSRKMAASHRVEQIALLLLSTLTLASTQGMYHPTPSPEWMWNNGAVLPSTLGKQSSTYENGELPYHGFTMNSPFNPIVPQQAHDSRDIYSRIHYLPANRNARTRTGGARAVTKQSPSYGEMHEGTPLIDSENHMSRSDIAGRSSLTHHHLEDPHDSTSMNNLVSARIILTDEDKIKMNADKSSGHGVYSGKYASALDAGRSTLDNVRHRWWESTPGKQSLTYENGVLPYHGFTMNSAFNPIVPQQALDPRGIYSRINYLPANRIAHTRTDGERAVMKQSPSYGEMHDGNPLIDSENHMSRSDITGRSSLTHYHLEDPHDSTSMNNLDSARSILTDEDKIKMNAEKSSGHGVYSGKYASELEAGRSTLDNDQHRSRESARAVSSHRLKETTNSYGSGPVRLTGTTSEEEFMESLATLRQSSHEFLDIYQEIVSHYATDLKRSLEMPTLERDISSAENSDYLNKTVLSTDFQYAVAKGKHIIELYQQNLNMLRFLSLISIARRTLSRDALDELISQKLERSDFDLNVRFHTDEDGPSVINFPDALDDTISIRIMVDEPLSQELEGSDIDLEVRLHLDEDDHGDRNSSDTLDDTIKSDPNVRITLDEPISQVLVQSDLDLEDSFHIDGDRNSHINSPDALDDTIKTAQRISITLDEPITEELELSDLDFEVTLHIDGDDHRDINSPEALDEAIEIAPSVDIMSDEPISHDLELSVSDLDVSSHIDLDHNSDINSPDALDDTINTDQNLRIKLDGPISQELERSDLEFEVTLHIDGDDHRDINSPEAFDEALEIAPSVHIMSDEPISQDLELSDLDLEVVSHIEEDGNSEANSPEVLADTLKTAATVRTMLDEPSSQEVEPSVLDLDVVFHMDGYSDTVILSPTDTEPPSASTRNAENESTGEQSDANYLIQLLQKNDNDRKSQAGDETSLRIDGDVLPDEKNGWTSLKGTADSDDRTFLQTSTSLLTVDTVKDRLHEPTENDNQTLESRLISKDEQDNDDLRIESRSSNGVVEERGLDTTDLQQTSYSESVPVSDSDRMSAMSDAVTLVIHKRSLTTNASPLTNSDSRQTGTAVSHQDESMRSTGKSVVNSPLVENAPQERIKESVLLGSFAKNEATNLRQRTDAIGFDLGSKSMGAQAEGNKSRNRARRGTNQFHVEELQSYSQNSLDSNPAGHNGYTDEGTIATKLGGRENGRIPALQQKDSWDQRSHISNSDNGAAFLKAKGATEFPNRKFAVSHPDWIVGGRRSANQMRIDLSFATNADEVPLTRSQVSHEADNYEQSSDESAERIEKLSTDHNESIMTRSLRHISINQQSGFKPKITKNHMVQADSTEPGDKSISLQPRLLIKRDVATEINTTYTKLVDNIRDSEVVASKIKNFFERVGTIPHTKKLQRLDFVGNQVTNNTSYFEEKVNASVRHILTKYSTKLSDILENILAKDTETVVPTALLIYYLAKQRVLNNLLLTNVAHVAKLLNETKRWQHPSMASGIAPAPSRATHLFPKEEEEEEEEVETIDRKTYLLPPTLPQYGPTVIQIDHEAVKITSITSPAHVFSTNHTNLNKTVNSHKTNLSQPGQNCAELSTPPTKGTSQQTIPTQNQKPLQSKISPHQWNFLYFPEKGIHQQTMKAQSRQPVFAYNIQKYHTPIQPQTQKPFVDYGGPQHLASQYFLTRETPQQATQLQTQESFSAYNTPKHKSPVVPQIQQWLFNNDSPLPPTSWYFPEQGLLQHASKPHIQQPLPVYKTPQRYTPLNYHKAQIQQLLPAYKTPQHIIPFSAYNSPQHQAPFYFSRPPIQQPLPVYNIPQHGTSPYFLEPQIQQPFPAYNAPQHQTPVYFSEPQLQPIIADSLKRYFESQNLEAAHSSTVTLSEQNIGLHVSVQTWATNKIGSSAGNLFNLITPNSPIQLITKGEQNTELIPVTSSVHEVVQSTKYLIISETPAEFLQSEWLLQMLRNDYVQLLCSSLIESSENDVTVDRNQYTDTFSAVVADYILRLFDKQAGGTSGNYEQTTIRQCRYCSETTRKSKINKRSEVFGDGDSRYSSDIRSTLGDSDQMVSSAITKNVYSEQLERLLHSPSADPLFYRSFYKYCKIDTNSFFNCTPTKAPYKGSAPTEVYQILMYLALERTIPNLCPSLFARPLTFGNAGDCSQS